MNGHRPQRLYPKRCFVDDPKQAVTGSRSLQELRLFFRDLDRLARWGYHLDGTGVRTRLAQLARHGGVLGATARCTPDRQVPDLYVHIELQVVLLQLFGDVDV
jgi:hypothetical protein